jgi:hypothetical protein
MDKFEQMVEAIEETEDMVECKECFDLFPKVDCTKLDHGYICPTCGRDQPRDFQDVSFTDITTDLYDQEFPDVMNYDSDFRNQIDERRPDYDIDTMVDVLIKDEFDAIDSYEMADEVIQHAAGDEEIKDELLDTIEHIKEEEEEHIDELNKAAGRVEADPEDEKAESEEDSDSDEEKEEDKDEDEDDKDDDKAEDDKEKNEDLTEDIPSPEMVEGEEILDEKKESVFSKIWKPVNESLWICKFKDAEIGKVSAETEEEALEKMQKEFPEYNYGECDGCFEVYQECADSECAEGGDILTEEVLDEGPGGFLKDVGRKIGHTARHIAHKDTGKQIDNFFNQGYTIRFISKQKTNDKIQYPKEHGETFESLDKAMTAALDASKNYTNFKVAVIANAIDTKGLTPREVKLADIKNGMGAHIATYENGVARINNSKKIEDEYRKIRIDNKDTLKTLGRVTGEGSNTADPRNEDESEEEGSDDTAALEEAKKKAKEALGAKVDKANYTPESYASYEAEYDKVVAAIDNCKTIEEINNLNITAKLTELLKLLKKKSETTDTDTEEDGDLEAEGDSVEDLRKQCLDILGEKEDAAKYTEESYAKYSEKYDKYKDVLTKAKKPESFKKYLEQLPGLVEKIKQLLQLKPEDEADGTLDDTTETDLTERKNALADKFIEASEKYADTKKYTEESVNAFEDSVLEEAEKIEALKTEEELDAFEAAIETKVKELAKVLVALSGDTSDESENDESSEETEDDEDKVKGKLRYTNSGRDLPEQSGFPKQDRNQYHQLTRQPWTDAIGELKSVLIGSGARTDKDFKLLVKKFIKFMERYRSEFVFEAFKRKLIRNNSLEETEAQILSETLTNIYKENLSLREDMDEPTATCSWCDQEFLRSECRYEVDLGWLCSRCEMAIKSRGETLTFREGSYWDFLDEEVETPEVTEDLKTTGEAVAELKDTEQALKGAAAGLKTMTAAMKG